MQGMISLADRLEPEEQAAGFLRDERQAPSAWVEEPASESATGAAPGRKYKKCCAATSLVDAEPDK
jgi:hypothetical protein